MWHPAVPDHQGLSSSSCIAQLLNQLHFALFSTEVAFVESSSAEEALGKETVGTYLLLSLCRMDILEEMAVIEAGSASKQGQPTRGVIPSPRGIQDLLLEFPTAPQTAAELSPPLLFPHPSEVCELDSQCPDPQQTAFHPLAIGSTNLHSPSSSNEVGYPFAMSPPPVVVPQSNFAHAFITPWLDERPSQVNSGNDCMAMKEGDYIEPRASPVNEGKVLTPASATEAQMNSGSAFPSSSPLSLVIESHGAPSKVMPPTAKSILERRERAIREGRRHEAKLNCEERRILRRLRNRESAERCAKRKAEEAELLTGKIDDLEVENARLRSVAAQFESAVFKLEQYLGARAQPTGTVLANVCGPSLS